MEKENIISIGITILIMIVLGFLGATITGYYAKTVSYDDICKSDEDCRAGEVCCRIEEGIGICDSEYNCQSVQLFCKSDSECEEGTVCCISEGMKYGICNYEDKCMSIEFFAEYTRKTAKPAPLGIDDKWVKGAAVIFVLAVAWFLLRKKKR